MNYYERHIGDYLKDTAHLSLLEHGVYGRLLDVYYTREEPLPAAEVARLVGARSKDEREALSAVLREFFVPDQEPPTAWLQRRCEDEIARFRDKQSKAKRSADARWSAHRSQSERNAIASPDAMRTHSEGNAPSNQTPDTKEIQKPPDPSGRPPLGSRLPDGWEPGPEGMAFAEAEGLRNGRAAQELAKFRDYWAAQPGAKGRKADWPATWRNWARRAAEDGAKAKPSGVQAEPQWRREQRERNEAFAGPAAAKRRAATTTLDMEVTDAPGLLG